ncbi:hypothetical protein F751_5213 [Auxenochlorella protothecoides]|uniref:Uncharacterized protein n=1 Tax=Auxenochlorella protothecoides TaxID=3075 RepID=A0A087SQU8_AUXPR|nr:hypothetical protein F751_5213 [Auxenochlorella protothecoides]KFM28102.1 hypothetical protein F751_5213 [Auxenochlorella protothecoides]
MLAPSAARCPRPRPPLQPPKKVQKHPFPPLVHLLLFRYLHQSAGAGVSDAGLPPPMRPAGRHCP